MTTYAFPALTPTSQTFGFAANTKTFTSPITRAVQTVQRGGEAWRMRLMFANLDVTERQVMQAFIVALNGQENRFSCQDHTLTQRGPLGGTPLVNGASQVGSALVIDGCTPSITGWGKAGDQFQVGNELKMLTADCNTDSGGATTLVFKPALRVSPADNAAIIVSSPKGLWMLSGPSNDWSSGAGVIFSDFTLDCVEDVLG